jgi:hypothetical protein
VVDLGGPIRHRATMEVRIANADAWRIIAQTKEAG